MPLPYINVNLQSIAKARRVVMFKTSSIICLYFSVCKCRDLYFIDLLCMLCALLAQYKVWWIYETLFSYVYLWFHCLRVVVEFRSVIVSKDVGWDFKSIIYISNEVLASVVQFYFSKKLSPFKFYVILFMCWTWITRAYNFVYNWVLA
jgi:hypothetical protein